MKLRNRQVWGFGLGVVLFGAVLYSHLGTVAAAGDAQSGIVVSPAQVTLDLQPGKRQVVAAVAIKNNYKQQVRFSATLEGMRQNTDGSLVPGAKLDAVLQTALTATPDEFQLEAGQSLNIQLQLTDSDKLPPGGQYAALVIAQKTDTPQNLTFTPAVSVGVFLVKEAGAVRKIQLSTLTVGGGVFKAPATATVGFTNAGNVMVVPRASVKLYDPRGTLLAAGVANQESLSTLPGAKPLRVQVPLRKIATSWLPGKYVLRVVYRYDGAEASEERLTSRFVVPLPFVGTAVGGLLLLVIIVRFGARRLLRAVKRPRRRKPVPAPSVKPKPRNIDGIIRP